jgi:hypothetical protein
MGLLAVVVEGGCGGDAASHPDGAGSGDFISGEVDGVSIRAAFEPAAGTTGVDAGEIWVVAGKTSMLDGWKVYIPNAVGTTTCPPSWLALFETENSVVCSDGPGASCTVTVTAAAPAMGDVVEGTFTATLSPYGADPATARTSVVTNGAFHVTRNLQ